ncbi:hypothetical protein [Rhodopila sp.]|uniref:hypothetical protein n=1 Tax=Rhodopila sp. TaxID=2480087 RepID=UPI003D0B287A
MGVVSTSQPGDVFLPVRRLRTPDAKNARLKKLLAEAMLNNAMLKDMAEKVVTPAAPREAVAHRRGRHAMIECRACRILG